VSKKEPHHSRGWTPVRRGKIYCSPMCGGKCTYRDYQRAVKDAAKLAKRLGPKWKPHMWDNLGWHWQVMYFTHGVLRASIWRGYGGHYHASIGGVYTAHATTPEAALYAALKELDASIAVQYETCSALHALPCMKLLVRNEVGSKTH